MQITPINSGRGYFERYGYTYFERAQSLRIPPWDKKYDENIIIEKALNELQSVIFAPEDMAYIRAIGIHPSFLSGSQVLNFLKMNDIKIKFEKFVPESVHAQYSYEKKTIFINDNYRNTQNFSEILAIASSIMHEAGHASDGDFANSVQEELDSLSLNVLTHRYFKKKYPDAFNDSHSFIIDEGVSLYDKLFFDKDNTKMSLIQRVYQKYGFLPAGDYSHPPGIIALKVKGQL